MAADAVSHGTAICVHMLLLYLPTALVTSLLEQPEDRERTASSWVGVSAVVSQAKPPLTILTSRIEVPGLNVGYPYF